MRIGILGGTFNPIHIGHLVLASEVLHKLKLEKIIFVPSFLPPHKSPSGIISADDRFKMVKFAIRGNSDFSVSDIEIKRKGKSYTIDTITEFKKHLRTAKFYFIIGSDYLGNLDNWRQADELKKLVKFVIVSRPGFKFSKNKKDKFIFLSINTPDISARQIRSRLKENKSIKYLISPEVERYIFKNNLYKNGAPPC